VTTLLSELGRETQSWTERAGFNPDASIHWLRHAHASHAIDNGAPITFVSAILGHADLKTTSVYAQATR
jgi:site-specific recombinase XerD